MATDTVEVLKSQVLNMISADKAKSAEFILDPFESESERVWRAEIARRAKKIRDITAIGSPSDDVITESRNRCKA